MVEAQQVHLGGGGTQVSAEATGAEIRCTGPGAPHDPQAAADSSSLPASGGFRWVRQGDRRWAFSPHFPGPACPRVQASFVLLSETEVFVLGYGECDLADPFEVVDCHTVTYAGDGGDENFSKSSPNSV